MSHKVIKYPYGIYCLILYKTWFGIPIFLRGMTLHSQDELLDAINRYVRPDKELSDLELRRKKNQLLAEYEAALSELRRRAYKMVDAKK